MEPYARAFVRFLHAAVIGRTRVEAFALGTRLTRVTRELATRDPDAGDRRSRPAGGRLVGRNPIWATACASSTTRGECGVWREARLS